MSHDKPKWKRIWKRIYVLCLVTKLCLTLCNSMDCGMPHSSVLHCLLEFAQIHVHWVGDALQPSHPLSPSSPFALNLFQHQRLFQWVGSSHHVAKVLELQLQHQSFQWIFRIEFHIYMYNWITLLYRRNWHNLVNQVYVNNFFFFLRVFISCSGL